MPEVIIKYKNERSLKALKDLSKYLDFDIVKPTKPNSKKKNLLSQIEEGLKDVKAIQSGKKKPKTLQDILNEK